MQQDVLVWEEDQGLCRAVGTSYEGRVYVGPAIVDIPESDMEKFFGRMPSRLNVRLLKEDKIIFIIGGISALH